MNSEQVCLLPLKEEKLNSVDIFRMTITTKLSHMHISDESLYVDIPVNRRFKLELQK
jgi:hypothetical protein